MRNDVRQENEVCLSEVLDAIDRVESQVESEDFTGATREMVLEGTVSRVKTEVKALVE